LHFDGISRSRLPRIGPAIGTIAVQLGLCSLLLIPNRAEPKLIKPTLSAFDVRAISIDPKPEPKILQPKPVKPMPPQPVVVPPPEIILPISPTLAVTMPDQSASASSDGGCDLTEPVRAALQSSDAVRASLPLIPPDQRSVANAVMVWKVGWLSDDEQLDKAAIAAIRTVVAETVAAATPECRMQPQTGPRLLLLSGTRDTVVLAVGSGQWRWQDLLDTARPEWTGEGMSGADPSAYQIASVDRASIAR
jgi:hypothetical protein